MGRVTKNIPMEQEKVQKGEVLVSTTRNKHLALISLIGMLNKRIGILNKRGYI